MKNRSLERCPLGPSVLLLAISLLWWVGCNCAGTPGSVGKENIWSGTHPTPEGRTIQMIEEQTGPPDAFSEGSLVDAETIWTSGNEIKKTTNGGRTWMRVRPSDDHPDLVSSYTNNNNSVYFISGERGWAEFGGSGTWQTEDSGRTFRLIFANGSDLPVFYGDFGWVNVRTSELSAEHDVFRGFVSHSLGKTWTSCESPLEEQFSLLGTAQFLKDGIGWAIVTKQIDRSKVYGVAKTTDGGCHWKLLWKSTENPDEAYRSIFFLNEREGWLGGYENGSMYRTEDGGISWKPVRLPSNRTRVWSMYFSDRDNGWLLAKPFERGDTAGIFKTTDGGNTWHVVGGKETLPQDWSRGLLYCALTHQAH